jgi:competence protein ComEC
MLVDGGGSYNFDPGEHIVTPYLLRQGIGRLDVAVLTHPDLDHLKGLVAVTRNFRPREIWSAPWPEDFSELYQTFRAVSLRSARPPLASLRAGRDFGPARVEILWPPADYKWPARAPGGSWANNMGLVLRLSYGGVSFLITGDIEKETERELAWRYGDALESTVLIAPHHGSRDSLTDEFVRAVGARWIVFAAGRNNSFGLPHPEALARAEAAGAAVWRTDLAGAAVFEAAEVQGVIQLVGPE